MTLAERLSGFVRAAFAGLWVRSFEHDDAIAEIARTCRRQGWNPAAWDIDRGLNLHGRGSESGTAVSAGDPLSAIRALGAMVNPDGTSILVLRNFDKFLGNIEVVQALDSAVAAGKTARTFVVVLSPVVQVPVELERQFVVIEHDLPGRDKLERIARGVATEPGELPEGATRPAVGAVRVQAGRPAHGRGVRTAAALHRGPRPCLMAGHASGPDAGGRCRAGHREAGAARPLPYRRGSLGALDLGLALGG